MAAANPISALYPRFDPFTSLFFSFHSSLKNNSDFLLTIFIQSVAQQLFPILEVRYVY